jgi:hypothetical protein
MRSEQRSLISRNLREAVHTDSSLPISSMSPLFEEDWSKLTRLRFKNAGLLCQSICVQKAGDTVGMAQRFSTDDSTHKMRPVIASLAGFG